MSYGKLDVYNFKIQIRLVPYCYCSRYFKSRSLNVIEVASLKVNVLLLHQLHGEAERLLSLRQIKMFLQYLRKVRYVPCNLFTFFLGGVDLTKSIVKNC